MSVRPGNIHWLKLKDMPVNVDPMNRGFAAMNEELFVIPFFFFSRPPQRD